MLVICSWCDKFIKEKEPLWDKSISHTICEECYEKATVEIRRFEEREDRKKVNRGGFSETIITAKRE